MNLAVVGQFASEEPPPFGDDIGLTTAEREYGASRELKHPLNNLVGFVFGQQAKEHEYGKQVLGEKELQPEFIVVLDEVTVLVEEEVICEVGCT